MAHLTPANLLLVALLAAAVVVALTVLAAQGVFACGEALGRRLRKPSGKAVRGFGYQQTWELDR